ncbi:NADP-dependent oxidoreductase [Paenibacillus frigoriresistens]|uniref:NADP-dependent oxidoreductase n=1 Tax=Paenibacillus alginolyticus TaxID=59839 RepID=UPI0015642AD2|nr:NADP-dependent oxidoreductase [Paenibacillus frigoriresistens]NRF94632.1 NADP-dependent oxidoreductase [Paenibacillus frigoriresistens]
MSVNKQFILASRPQGMPTAENFTLIETAMPKPAAGQALVRTVYLSVDPYMRGRMNEGKSYVPPYQVGQVITGGTVGVIVESQIVGLQEGDFIAGQWGWQTHALVTAGQARKLDPNQAPISTALGVLGMTGLTAYLGLLDIGQPKEGETVVVSGAAGAVGMIAGQIAKIKGARTVGIAGSDEKAKYLMDELGFDAVINYKKSSDIQAELTEACPAGVDVYFDNVGGVISDSVLKLLNKGARIPVCGQISLYNLEQPDVGPRIQSQLLISSALMKGFIVGDYAPRFPEGLAALAQWLRENKIKYAEHVIEGFENTPKAFLALFSGENLGKQLVKTADM